MRIRYFNVGWYKFDIHVDTVTISGICNKSIWRVSFVNSLDSAFHIRSNIVSCNILSWYFFKSPYVAIDKYWISGT